MKKLVFFAFIFIILLFTFPINGKGNHIEESELQVIPDEAIRLRILANSDNKLDQHVKLEVRDAVNEQITGWVKHLTDIDAARRLIRENIDEIEQTVENTIKEYDVNHEYHVEYNKKVAFPEKTYGTTVYPEGDYEAVLITLGKGVGENWWCVLFPPLCFLDFSQEVSAASPEELAKEEEEEEVEVKFFLFEWLKDIF